VNGRRPLTRGEFGLRNAIALQAASPAWRSISRLKSHLVRSTFDSRGGDAIERHSGSGSATDSAPYPSV
jgi:hypothetical protein